MKKPLLLVLALAIGSFLQAQTPCSGGTADGYDCNGMTLQARLTIAQMGGQGYGGSDPAEAQDSWGWTDPNTGKEYALVAMNDKTSFVDISNPNNPVFIGKLDSQTGTSWWRDVKVFNNYAYIVSDDNGSHGVQIFNLEKLRNPDNDPLPINFTRDGLYTNISSAHNLIIDEENGFAYILGSNRNGGGPRILDLNTNPTNPTVAGNIATYGYCHDAQVITYNGPDTEHIGKQLFIGSFSGSDYVRILDVTNKSNVTSIGSIDYSDKYYTHQGWFTEDQRFFIVGDELDETNGPGFNTRTLVFDLTDLDNPVLHYTHYGATPAIDHNGYVKGNRFYLANYRAGMRVFKFEDLYDPAITNNQMEEVEFFDTHPGSNSAAYNGAWNVYPFFESGNIIVSDLDRGLFIVKDPNYDSEPPVVACQNYTAVLDKTTGTVTIDASDIDGGSTDNFGIVKRTVTGQTTFTCADLGDHTVTLTVEDDYGLKTSCTTTVTVVAETTVYQGGGSWSNGLPDVGSLAKISTNDYNTSDPGNASFSACSCEVDTNRVLTVGPDDHILINGDIIVDGSLMVKHTGNVVQINPNAVVTKGASAVINVEITTPVLQTRDFMVMGSPMDAETRDDVFTDAFLVLNSNSGNFIPHPDVGGGTNFADDNGDYWTSYTGPINVGEGYIVRPQDGYSDPANEAYYMTYAEGTLNNGTILKGAIFNNITENPDGTPNAVSNPYASAISGYEFIDQNDLVNEIYFWEHLTPPNSGTPGSNSINFSMGDISMYNLSGGTKASNDPGISTIPNGIISTGQGFSFRSLATNNVEFNNSMRLTSGNTTLRSHNESELDKIWINLRSVTYDIESNTLLAFNPEANTAINPGFDSGRVGSFVSLYTYHSDTKSELGIQTTSAFNPDMKFPLGFETLIDEGTLYEISIDQLIGQRIEKARVFLYDFQEGITTELSTTPYEFRSNATNTQERFTLFFVSDEVLGPNDEEFDNIVVYPNPTKNILNILSAQAPLERLEIYDLRGRLIQEDIEGEDIVTTSLDISRLRAGVYFVKIFTATGTITKKVIKE
ncbi:choice-of-anchor B family protein [Rasiella sp. SM2506]|uniref:choice-of-anchor B family protein n=1 Tax=Rasiella sp. SM2506 TaxID=3423914 RepID=UPI003D7BC5DB